MSSIKIKEIKVKSILTKSRLPETDYVINPYTGCMHGCVYCYSVFMKRFTNHKEPWGKFVDVKINAAEMLEREIKRATKGTVLLSSVTDPYHPLESKYKLTRKILEILLEHQFPVSILTKSDMVTRDIDLLKKFKKCDIGFSFLSFDDSHRRNFEPVAVSPQRRLEAMKILKENRITTYAFIGPIFPELTNLDEMFKKFKELKTDFVFCENLNHKAGTWNGIFDVIKKKYPKFVDEYQRIFFTKNSYWKNVEKHVKQLSKEYDIETKIYFHHGDK